MTSRETYPRPESFELRVLAALATGASLPVEIAAGLTDSPDHVRSVLDQAVQTELVARADQPSGPSYSLTQKGLGLLGLTQGTYDAARAVAAENVVREQDARPADVPTVPDAVSVPPVDVGSASRKVTWRHLVYAAVYVLLGLVLILVQPVVGLLLVVGGLVLGGFTLRPLLRTPPPDRGAGS